MTRPHVTLRRSGRAAAERGSIMLSLLLAIVVTALIAAATISAIAGHQKSRAAEKFTTAQQDADTAMADAMRFANQGGLFTKYPSQTQARVPDGTAAESCTGKQWCWWATPTANGAAGTEYDLHVQASSKTKMRRYVAHVSSLNALPNAGWMDDVSASYGIGEGPMTNGFMARDLKLRRGSTIDSYNAPSGTAATGNGIASTLFRVSFDETSSADRVVLWDFIDQPDKARCSGAWCTLGEITVQDVGVDYWGQCGTANPYPASDCTQPTKFIDEACKNATLKPWIASENGTNPILPAGLTVAGNDSNGKPYYCASSLVFDRDTKVNTTPNNPVKIYVTGGQPGNTGGYNGSVTVAPGVNVNATDAAPKSAALLIYAKVQYVTLMAGGAADTKVAWGMWAPMAYCGGDPDPAGLRTVRVYGSMTCEELSATGWQMRYDEQMRLLRPVNAAPARAWFVTSFRAA